MAIPIRAGISEDAWQRAVRPLDRERDAALTRRGDATDLGGIAVIWAGPGTPAPHTLHIQPGVADDLPSLLSALARELAWPGVPDAPEEAGHAVAAWARVWQVRDAADLRLTLHWDVGGAFTAAAERRRPDHPAEPVAETPELIALLNELAVAPCPSASPHGLLLAGNHAMVAEDYPRARAYYEQAARELPRHPEAHRNLALALARLGEWEAAAAAMRQARDLAPADDAVQTEYLALETDAGIRAVQENDLARAGAHFLRILALWPTEPTALANLGTIRLREGRHPEARAIYQRFLRHHPTHPAAEQIRLTLAEMGGA